jgi:hypothetical protein
MKKNSTALVDKHLECLKGMQEAVTDDFFYTRIKARMESGLEEEIFRSGWRFSLKPVWAISTLILLLALNGFILFQQGKTKKGPAATTSSSLQSFAEFYDQTISSSY